MRANGRWHQSAKEREKKRYVRMWAIALCISCILRSLSLCAECSLLADYASLARMDCERRAASTVCVYAEQQFIYRAACECMCGWRAPRERSVNVLSTEFLYIKTHANTSRYTLVGSRFSLVQIVHWTRTDGKHIYLSLHPLSSQNRQSNFVWIISAIFIWLLRACVCANK